MTALLNIHGPALLYGLAKGATLPVISITAVELGASTGLAALVVSVVGLGAILGAIPSSAVIVRFSENSTMVVASLLGAVGMATAAFTTNLPLLIVGVVTLGLAGPALTVARQSHLAATVAPEHRAKAMSALSGMVRTGLFAGPFLSAAALVVLESRGPYLVAGSAMLGSALSIAAVQTYHRRRYPVPTGPAEKPKSVSSTVRQNRRRLGKVSAVVVAVMATRGARPVAIPLWAEHLGLDASLAALIYGISGAVELLVFYPAGAAMDRWGRKVVAIPAMVVMAVGLFWIPLSSDALGLILASAVVGLGNGLSAGIVMTLGIDMAPVRGRIAFLGVVRTVAECGSAAGLGGMSLAMGLGGLAAGMWVIGAVAVGAGVLIWHYVPHSGQSGP